MKRTQSGRNFLALFILVFLLFQVFLYFRLDALPGEWYGDITALNDQVMRVRRELVALEYICASGPLYSYVITPLVTVFGNTHFGYKLASAVISTIGWFLISYLGYTFYGRSGKTIATAFFAGTSFWYLSWSRLGSTPVMLAPILLAGMLILLERYLQTGNPFLAVAGGTVSALGLLLYPGAYLYPLVWVLVFLIRRSSGEPPMRTVQRLVFALSGMVPVVMLFGYMVMTQPGNFASGGGYIGMKILPMFEKNPGELARIIGENVYHLLLMFHVRGDEVFRVNVPRTPHLDPVSGVLFIVGLGSLFMPRRKRYWSSFVIPLLIVPLPSIMPALPQREIPSMTRTIGMLPVVFLLLAEGLDSVISVMRRVHPAASLLMLSGMVCAVTYLNMYKYFVQYPQTLPNRNSPYGKILARYIDDFPPQVAVRMTGCCWGDWGQPEVQGIYYNLRNRTGRENILRDERIQTCQEVDTRSDTLLIISPSQPEIGERFRMCFPSARTYDHIDEYGQHVFTSLYIPRRLSK